MPQKFSYSSRQSRDEYENLRDKDKLQYVEKNNSFLIIIIGVINKFLVVPNICALKVIASLDIRVVIKYMSDLIELGINYTFDQIR